MIVSQSTILNGIEVLTQESGLEINRQYNYCQSDSYKGVPVPLNNLALYIVIYFYY